MPISMWRPASPASPMCWLRRRARGATVSWITLVKPCPGNGAYAARSEPRELGRVQRFIEFRGLRAAGFHLLGTLPEFFGAALRAAGGFPEQEGMFADAG